MRSCTKEKEKKKLVLFSKIQRDDHMFSTRGSIPFLFFLRQRQLKKLETKGIRNVRKVLVQDRLIERSTIETSVCSFNVNEYSPGCICKGATLYPPSWMPVERVSRSLFCILACSQCSADQVLR